MNNGEFIVKYTTKDIMGKLEDQDRQLNEILDHVKKTNGRVTKLECNSVGMFISKHPKKFVMVGVLIISLLVSQSRDLVVDELPRLLIMMFGL